MWHLRFYSSFLTQRPEMETVSNQLTKLHLVCSKLDWKIDNFDKLMRVSRLGQDLVSDHFCVPQADDIVWELHIYPKGKREEDANNVSLFLRQVGMRGVQEPIMTEFRVYCICPPPMPVYNVCRDNKEFVHQQGRGKFKVSYDRITQALHPDGSLRVICEVEFVPPGSVWKATSDPTRGESEKLLVAASHVDLRRLLETSVLSDCVIKVGDALLKCHRCILALHSEVFCQMFEHTVTSEARNGLVEIPDTTEAAAKAMLEFMYTGQVSDLDRHAFDILPLSEKYGIAKLKDMCETSLHGSFNIDNVCQMLIFADTYRALRIRDAAIKYISENHGQLLDTKEWKSLKETNPILASDILEVVLGGSGTSRTLSVSYASPVPLGSASDSSNDTGSDDAPAESAKPPPKKRTRRSR